MTAVVAIASLAATAIGGIMQYEGAQQQAAAKAQADQYQAAVADRNAQAMAKNAQYEREKGLADAQNQDLKARAQLGAIDAGVAASGFDMSSGSKVNIRSSAAELARLDTLTVVGNANRRARDFDIESANAKAQSGFYQMQASNDREAGQLNAYASLLGGATAFGDRFTDFKKAGVFG